MPYNMGSAANPRTFTRESLNTAAASGGQRSNPFERRWAEARARNAAPPPLSLGGQTQKFNMQLRGASLGYANLAGRRLNRELGTMLGDLNSIGALRSGAVQAGVNLASQRFGETVGDYSNTLAVQGAQMAQEEYDRNTERAFRERQYNDARRASRRRGLGRALGTLGGGVIGFMAGGPAGAMAGAKVGQGVFG